MDLEWTPRDARRRVDDAEQSDWSRDWQAWHGPAGGGFQGRIEVGRQGKCGVLDAQPRPAPPGQCTRSRTGAGPRAGH